MVEIIAEIGSNHANRIQNAFDLIDAAAKAKATYAKFQLFGENDLWRKDDPRYKPAVKYALPPNWVPMLKKHCDESNIEFLCTPFSPASVELLEGVGVGAYKVASGDLTYIPLLEAIAKTKKQVYLSVGGGTFEEIDTALDVLNPNDVVIMHCIPDYPSSPRDANVTRLVDLAERYLLGRDRKICPIGLSSHLRQWWIDAACVLYRAYAIEKHIDLEGRPGPEGKHSLDVNEFAQFTSAVRDMELAIQKHAEFSGAEEYARNNYRRSNADWLRPASRS